jgi:acyl-CoA synthetase (AMP-forming)/AMP-acid ligase II
MDPGVEGCAYLGDPAEYGSAGDPAVTLGEDDLLWFQYTSGTTGLPKGAMLTQGVAGAIVEICHSAIQGKVHFDRDTKALQVLPSYSFSGAAYDILYQWIGALTVIMETFNASEMMALIEKHRITDCHIVPVILSLMLQSPDFGKYDLSSLTCITYGAAPMPRRCSGRIEKIGPVFMQDYGASEAGALTILDIEDHVVDGPPEKVRRLASCGKPIPGVSVKVLNERGEEVKPGEIGELTTKSPMVMKGYWKMPEETNASLRDGRFHTGDLCTVDEEGYIYVKDRKKDMIISGGFNIYPFELESVLQEHPAIADAAVFGIPDDQWGESVCAHVVLHQGGRRPGTDRRVHEEEPGELTEAEADRVRGAASANLSGKLLKRELRQKYWEGRERNV